VSVFKVKKSPYYQFDFVLRGHRFYGSTECTVRKEAEKFEAVEREKAKELVKAMKRSKASLLIDDVAARLWNEQAQYDADPEATETNFARLVDYFGKSRSLTEIDHAAAKKMVAWRRGHRIKGRADALLISNSTVNRSSSKVLQRFFSFAKAEGAQFDHEPKWTELQLPEPEERVRELQEEEAVAFEDAMRTDYEPFLRVCPGERHATEGVHHPAVVRGEFRDLPDRSAGEGRSASGLSDHGVDPGNSAPASRPAPRVRFYLRCCLWKQAAGQGARRALPTNYRRSEVGMAADAR
jgi:hypothetical protein